MPKFTLFVAPGTCARVPTIALEEIGAPYETKLVRLPLKEQKTPEFLAINPKGKVPALLIDGVPLTENVAILNWLNRTYPDANLLPKVQSDLDAAQLTADLAAISGTIHPILTRIAMTKNFTTKESDLDGIRQAAVDAMAPFMAMINARLDGQSWWYGQNWSIVDAYISWVWWRLEVVDYPGEAFQNLKDHAKRNHQRPSVVRAMDSELIYARQMRADGLQIPHRDL